MKINVSLFAAPVWSLLAASYKCSLPPFLPLPPLSPPAGPFLSVIIGFQKAGRGHISHLPSSPLPSFTLILSFIFLLFNNSLSALWPLIKMNSLCCRLLPSSPSLYLCLSVVSFPFALIDPLPKISPPHLTYLPPYIFLDILYPPPHSPHSSLSSPSSSQSPLCKKLLSSLHSPHLSFLLQFLSV